VSYDTISGMPESDLPVSLEPHQAIYRLLEWDVVGWAVAASLGTWGAMIGIGQFHIAEWMLRISGALVAIPFLVWALKTRRPLAWVIVLLTCAVIFGGEWYAYIWTRELIADAESTKKKIDQIPTLKTSVDGLNQSIDELKRAMHAPSDLSADQVLAAAASKIIAMDKRIDKLSEFRHITPDLWSPEGKYTWKHGLETLTPGVSCFLPDGTGVMTGFNIIDRNTVIIGASNRIDLRCTLRR
jgi:hypothetical protein